MRLALWSAIVGVLLITGALGASFLRRLPLSTSMLYLLVGVGLGLLGSRSSRSQRGLMAWFGIRGIGSIYYLMYAINHGLERSLAEQLVAITVIVVAASIVVHGISVTPLMLRYTRRQESGKAGGRAG